MGDADGLTRGGMHFFALGPLDVRRDTATVPLTRRKSRMLLALLLARVNRAVPAEQLVDELWSGAPPDSGSVALRVHLTHLRRALGAGATTPIERRGGGYCVRAGREGFDVLAFEAALVTARNRAASGEPAEASESLASALRSWRGPAYADVRDLEVVHAEAVRLDNLRLAAIEQLADSELSLGRPERACEVLEHTTSDHPLREGLVERLMLALYRSGRQSEALREFSRLREALDEALGIPPSPSLRELELAIVLQRPELDAPRQTTRVGTVRTARVEPFIGRTAELGALEQAWAEVLAGAVRLVLVRGTAGVGKTALVHQLVVAAEGAGARVLVGSCEPDSTTEYGPFPHLVRKLIDAAPGPDLVPELGVLLPDLSDRFVDPAQNVDASAGRYRLFDAVSRLFVGDRSVPTVLVIEDLHWASADTVSLLRHVASHSSASLMLVGTYRHDEAPSDPTLDRALSQGRLAKPDVEITLDGLGTNELLALVQASAPEVVQLRLAGAMDELQEITNGNPLFVLEVVRDLAQTHPGPPLRDIAPDGVRALVQRRLGRLTPVGRTVLETGSVLGSQFSLRAVATTAGLSQGDALAGLEDAIDAGFLVEGEQLDLFTFCHPVVGNAIYRGITPSRRSRLHLRAGAVLEAEAELAPPRSARWAEPARHFAAALPLGEPLHAAELAVRAGHDASLRFAHGDAVQWYRSGLELADAAEWSPRQRSTALLALGEALERSGRRGEARAAFVDAARYAKEGEADDLVADIAIAATPRYATVDSFLPIHRELLDDALAVEHDDPRRQAWLLCSTGAVRYYDEPAEVRTATEGLALARRVPDPEVIAAALISLHRGLTRDPTSAEARLGLSRELVDLCDDEGLGALVGRARRTLLVDLLEAGDDQGFERELAEFTTVAAAQGVPADVYWASALRATRAVMVAPTSEAEDLIRAAKSLGVDLEQSEADGVSFLQTFALRYAQDRLRELAAGMHRVSVTALPDDRRIHAGLAPLAVICSESGREREARAILDRVVSSSAVLLAHDNMTLGALGLLAAVASRIGTTSQRRVLVDALTPCAEQWCVFGAGGAVFGPGHHWLGRLALALDDPDAARRHLGRAVEMASAAAAPHWAAVAASGLDALADRAPDMRH